LIGERKPETHLNATEGTSAMHSHKTKRLTLEALENRQVLSGNVAAVVSGGNLVVTGDNADNQIYIARYHENGAAVANTYLVGGFDGTTTVNGSSSPAIVRGVRSDMKISLKAGSDTTVLLGDTPSDMFTAPRNVVVSNDNGNDLLFAYCARANSLQYTGGNGNDRVTIINSTLGSLAFKAGNGENALGITGTSIKGDAVVQTGTAKDMVGLYSLSVGGKLQIATSSGNDFVSLGLTPDMLGLDWTDFALPSELADSSFGVSAKSLQIDTGAGDDSVSVRNSQIATDTTIALGDGDDGLGMRWNAFSRNVSVTMGTGNDCHELQYSVLKGSYSLDSGEGYDEARLCAISAKGFAVNMGGGDDTFSLDYGLITGRVIVDGGVKNDRSGIANRIGIGNTSISGDAQILGGSAGEMVGLSGVTVGGKLQIATASGNDVIAMGLDVGLLGYEWSDFGLSSSAEDNTFGVHAGSLQIDSAAGNDVVGIEASQVTSAVAISTGDGDDYLGMLNCTFSRDAKFGLGAGNDRAIAVTTRIGGSLAFDLGKGNDHLELEDAVVARDAAIAMSDGDDYFEFAAVRVTGRTTFDGGAGYDRSLRTAAVDDFFGRGLTDRNFEFHG
jgi:hypothetical protein